jgi:hypothetical protein
VKDKVSYSSMVLCGIVIVCSDFISSIYCHRMNVEL